MIYTEYFHPRSKQQHNNYLEKHSAPASISNRKTFWQLQVGPGGRQGEMKMLDDYTVDAIPLHQKGPIALGRTDGVRPSCLSRSQSYCVWKWRFSHSIVQHLCICLRSRALLADIVIA